MRVFLRQAQARMRLVAAMAFVDAHSAWNVAAVAVAIAAYVLVRLMIGAGWALPVSQLNLVLTIPYGYQAGDHARDRRLRQMDLRSRAPETAGFGQHQKDVQIAGCPIDMHNRSVYRKKRLDEAIGPS